MAVVIQEPGDDRSLVPCIAIALGVGEAGTLETAAAVTEAMIEADAGTDGGTFDEAGGSTGGLWDKFPAADAAVLQGMTPETDE